MNINPIAVQKNNIKVNRSSHAERRVFSLKSSSFRSALFVSNKRPYISLRIKNNIL